MHEGDGDPELGCEGEGTEEWNGKIELRAEVLQ